MSIVFQDFFTGSSLNAAWTRRNIVSGDETWNSPGLTVAGLVPGDFYLMTAPSGDFTVELEFTGKSTGSDMIGVAILDGSGGGIMASTYPNAVYNLTFSGYSYSGLFASPGGGNYAAARLRLTKVGLNFTTAYSTNGGASWSSESSALSPIASVSQIGVGCILGGGTIKLVELLVQQNVPDATVNAPVATATATAPAPAITASASVAAPVATATALAPAPTVTGTGDATVAAPVATATAEAPTPTLSYGASVAAPVATATATAPAPALTYGAMVEPPVATATAMAPAPSIDDGSGSQTVFSPVATATAMAHPPVITQVYTAGTDTANALGGRSRGGLAAVTITRPVSAAPTNLATKADKAMAYPVPTMVDGRPT